jgi:hypothetical protein
MASDKSIAKTPDVDRFTGFLTRLTGDHAYIHEGYAFTYAASFSLAGSATVDYILQTPSVVSGKFVHYRPTKIGTTASGVSVTLSENPTFTSGTDLSAAIFNRNRISTLTPGVRVLGTNLSVSDVGVVLYPDIIGATGTPSTNRQGVSGENEEIVFKQNEDYLIRITNLTSTTTTVVLNLFWYEEDAG